MESKKLLTRKRKFKKISRKLKTDLTSNTQKNNSNMVTNADLSNERISSPIDIDRLPQKVLSYEIDSWSSYISTFHPRNILSDNKISGAFSKWSVDFKSAKEYLYIKLLKTSIIYMITFGKFKDPTNLKEFKIYAGLDKTNMIEILHSGLSMDNEYEAFIVKYELENALIPCKYIIYVNQLFFSYIKIVPIRPWDDNYNISVWFLKLKGIDDDTIVKKSIENYKRHTELESMKLWLNLSRKNFKDKSLDLFKVKRLDNLIAKIENPCLTELYKSIMNGNYEDCIQILNKCQDYGLLNNYVNNLAYKIKWKRVGNMDKEIDNTIDRIHHMEKVANCNNTNLKSNLTIINAENINQSLNNFLVNIDNNEENDEELEIESILSGELNLMDEDEDFEELNHVASNTEDYDLDSQIDHFPSERGGHCMAIDSEGKKIFLFGGWNGHEDLNDFWMYDIKNETWKLISANASNENGPSKRSCTKMVYDSRFNRLLLYGKYSTNNEPNLDLYIYEYKLSNNQWYKYLVKREIINGVVAESTGPGQVFDHQLAIDSNNQILYLFGGCRVPETDDPVHGIFNYMRMFI